jgi:hypothetical protein
MSTRAKSGVPTAIRAVPRAGESTALEVAVALLTGEQIAGSGWAKAQTVSWRLPVQNLAQIDVLAEAANISRSRAALTIMNAGWMQILAALPDRAKRERFQMAMARAAEKRLRSRRTSDISF